MWWVAGWRFYKHTESWTEWKSNCLHFTSAPRRKYLRSCRWTPRPGTTRQVNTSFRAEPLFCLASWSPPSCHCVEGMERVVTGYTTRSTTRKRNNSTVEPVCAASEVARSLDIFSRTFCFSKRYGGLLQWAFAGGANWPLGPRKLD